MLCILQDALYFFLNASEVNMKVNAFWTTMRLVFFF